MYTMQSLNFNWFKRGVFTFKQIQFYDSVLLPSSGCHNSWNISRKINGIFGRNNKKLAHKSIRRPSKHYFNYTSALNFHDWRRTLSLHHLKTRFGIFWILPGLHVNFADHFAAGYKFFYLQWHLRLSFVPQSPGQVFLHNTTLYHRIS